MAAGLAWVHAARPLMMFRLLAGLLALIVTVRLWTNPAIVAEPGTTVIFNWLLPGHGIPAAALFLAAYLFRCGDPDCRVAPLLEGAGSAAAVLLVGTEIRHAMNDGRIDAAEPGLAELSLHSLSWLGFALGFHWLAARRGGEGVFRGAAVITGCLGALALGLGHLVAENPLFTADPVGEGRLFNLLLLAYALPALLLGALHWRLRGTGRELAETASGAQGVPGPGAELSPAD